LRDFDPTIASIGRVDDQERLEGILARLEDHDREWLIDRLDPPWRRQQRRVERRDQALRELGVRKFTSDLTLTSGRRMASAIRTDLQRYAASAFRFDRDREPPADVQRALWWRVLTLTAGNPPSTTLIRDALAGGRQSRRLLATPGARLAAAQPGNFGHGSRGDIGQPDFADRQGRSGDAGAPAERAARHNRKEPD
jgi:hypothetical protein